MAGSILSMANGRSLLSKGVALLLTVSLGRAGLAACLWLSSVSFRYTTIHTIFVQTFCSADH